MLRIHGVAKESKYENLRCFDFLAFYLRRADAEADVKNRNEKGVKVVSLEVNETYELVEE